VHQKSNASAKIPDSMSSRANSHDRVNWSRKATRNLVDSSSRLQVGPFPQQYGESPHIKRVSITDSRSGLLVQSAPGRVNDW
jgi:hypothetical protein